MRSKIIYLIIISLAFFYLFLSNNEKLAMEQYLKGRDLIVEANKPENFSIRGKFFQESVQVFEKLVKDYPDTVVCNKVLEESSDPYTLHAAKVEIAKIVLLIPPIEMFPTLKNIDKSKITAINANKTKVKDFRDKLEKLEKKASIVTNSEKNNSKFSVIERDLSSYRHSLREFELLISNLNPETESLEKIREYSDILDALINEINESLASVDTLLSVE